VLPILNQAAATYGISAAEMGRASVIGQPVHLLSPLVPSTYLLVGLVQVELGDHQRFTIRWSIITSLVLLLIGLVIGVIPVAGAADRQRLSFRAEPRSGGGRGIAGCCHSERSAQRGGEESHSSR